MKLLRKNQEVRYEVKQSLGYLYLACFYYKLDLNRLVSSNLYAQYSTTIVNCKL